LFWPVLPSCWDVVLLWSTAHAGLDFFYVLSRSSSRAALLGLHPRSVPCRPYFVPRLWFGVKLVPRVLLGLCAWTIHSWSMLTWSMLTWSNSLPGRVHVD
ncbi:unnamed protein product, partial [Choristocarpus tenellus]